MSRRIIVKSFNNPETEAMLQAFYSRSHKSIVEHLEDLELLEDEINNEKEDKIRKKLSKYYIGYGHDSIGDCGSTTVFIENVSIIAAKAIQNTPLYNGQESSTRYIDFSVKFNSLIALLTEDLFVEQCEDISGLRNDIIDIVETYKDIYFKSHDKIVRNLSSEDKYTEKSISSFAFDNARAFLPSGILTQLSFHGSLRNLKNHFTFLLKHPFSEVRQIAIEVLYSLNTKYPNSFSSSILLASIMKHDGEKIPGSICSIEDYYDVSSFDSLDGKTGLLNSNIYSANSNLAYTSISPKFRIHHNESSVYNNLSIFSSKNSNTNLDYGSWRDLQRHRNGFCKSIIPLYSPYANTHFIADAYTEIKEDSDYLFVSALMSNCSNDLSEALEKFYINYNEIFKQRGYQIDVFTSLIAYLTPLGHPVDTLVSYNVEEWDYIFDLRLRDTVHFSLVKWLTNMADLLRSYNPYFQEHYLKGKKIKYDLSVRRGTQHIQGLEEK